MSNLNELKREEKEELLSALEEQDRREKENKLYTYFTDEGERSRDKYKKAMMFFKAGSIYKERAMIASNRSGKSLTATWETGLHLTGLYSDFPWWPGKKFDEPVLAWAVGKTHETTRDILQRYLLGPKHAIGTGFIPKDKIIRVTSKPGVPDAIQDVYIKHASGGVSELSFKSYIQGVDSFMGTERHLIHLDEEPDDAKIYSECLTRTMTTDGIIMCTFTPLQGLSDVVLSFLPGGKFPPNGYGQVIPYE